MAMALFHEFVQQCVPLALELKVKVVVVVHLLMMHGCSCRCSECGLHITRASMQS